MNNLHQKPDDLPALKKEIDGIELNRIKNFSLQMEMIGPVKIIVPAFIKQ